MWSQKTLLRFFLIRKLSKFIRWYIKSERRYYSMPQSHENLETFVWWLGGWLGGGGGGEARTCTNLWFLWRSFQLSLRIFANWYQSEVEKHLVKGSIISARKIQNAENIKCNYLRTKKTNKQTKNRTNKIVARCGGYRRQDCQQRIKDNPLYTLVHKMWTGQHKNTQLCNETDIIYSTWRSFIVVAKSPARSCSLITLKYE